MVLLWSHFGGLPHCALFYLHCSALYSGLVRWCAWQLIGISILNNWTLVICSLNPQYEHHVVSLTSDIMF